jgi:hypothetical protein
MSRNSYTDMDRDVDLTLAARAARSPHALTAVAVVNAVYCKYPLRSEAAWKLAWIGDELLDMVDRGEDIDVETMGEIFGALALEGL